MTKKWLKKAELYLRFGGDMIKGLDVSDKAKREMFDYESTGKKCDFSRNGYYHGKRWLNWHITEFRKGIDGGTLSPFELIEDFGSEFCKEYLGVENVRIGQGKDIVRHNDTDRELQ